MNQSSSFLFTESSFCFLQKEILMQQPGEPRKHHLSEVLQGWSKSKDAGVIWYNRWFYFFINTLLTILVIRFGLQFYPKKKFFFIIFQYGGAQCKWSSSFGRCPLKISSFFNILLTYLIFQLILANVVIFEWICREGRNQNWPLYYVSYWIVLYFFRFWVPIIHTSSKLKKILF